MIRQPLLVRATLFCFLAWALGGWMPGCSAIDSLPDDDRTKEVDRQVRAKWGRALDQLPVSTLVIIGPHNENVQNEYGWAFSLYHAFEYGQRVRCEWRDVGGGASTIRTYLTNVYKRADSAGIDVMWGGGEFNFIPLAEEGLLEPLRVRPDVLANIPDDLGGVRLYDCEQRWIGTALSAFGFLYNAGLLKRCGIEPPKQWEDLADARFADLISLADPTQSGSAAAAYQTIARSGKDWPDGWAKLLRVLANAKHFTDSAGTAASAPVVGEALLAACIDSYGVIRVALAPDQIVYVSPKGQTTFSPDPIAILKNPPHPELAGRFVDFVLSRRGQALWALPVGRQDGPVRSPLGRQPIRKDVYENYKGKLLDSIVNPYEAGLSMTMAGDRTQIDFNVLRLLVRAAALDNAAELRRARQRLIAARFRPDLLAQFCRLPDDVSTAEKMSQLAKELGNETKRERTITDWQRFFRRKYRLIAERSDG